MKKFNTICVIVFFLIQIVHCTLSIDNCKAQSGWFWYNPQPTGNNLRTVFFTDAITGWMCGYQGTILKTTNGGENWFSQYSGTVSNLTKAFFINSSTGWISGSNQIFNGEILKTTNGGDNWQIILHEPGKQYYQLFFVSELTGWSIYYDQDFYYSTSIMKTTNGGFNWTEQWTENDTALNLSSLSFPSAATGYVIGLYMQNLYPFYSAYMMKTTNGGQTWTSEVRDSNTLLYSAFFISPTVGWAVGRRYTDFTSGVVMNTTNGGFSWTRRIITGGTLRSVYFTTPAIGWTVGEYGKIFMTNNGGSNWYEQQTGILNNLYSINFSSTTSGIAVGDFGEILRTTNSGSLWIKFPRVDSADFLSINFSSPDTGWIAGYNYSSNPGVITRTTNGGDNWIRYPVSFNKQINFIKSFNSVVWAVGNDGFVFKSTNYGSSWQPSFGSITTNLYSAYFTNQSTGWVAGNLVYKTTNGGGYWYPQGIGTYYTMRSVWFTSETNGIVVGDQGTISKTTNAGDNWTIIPSGTTATLKQVCFTDSENGWIAGDVLLRTTNGGLNWTSQMLEVYPQYIHFYSQMTGYVSGYGMYGPAIFKTTNGGGTWDEQYCPVQNGVSSIFFTSANTGWAVGYSGTILKTTTGGATVAVQNIYTEIPDGYNLSQNYPNPFNPVTNLEFGISDLGFVSLKIYDVLGKEVATLVNDRLSPGRYRVEFNGSGLTSGVYFYRLTAGEFTDTKRMLIVK